MAGSNERPNGARKLLYGCLGLLALWLLLVTLAVGGYLFWQYGIPFLAGVFDREPAQVVVYDQAYADSVCAETGVNSFNPQTGVVVCSDPVVAAVPTEVVQPTPIPPVPSGNTTSSEACLPLDKITTWSENSQGLVYRIEVGGHGGQHMDFYPEVGVKAVSYIIGEITPPEVAAIWWGYGSNLEGNPPGCTFDWIADATAYAEARLDSGHSGLVVDWRSGEPVVVANVAGLSQAQIDALLKLHYDGMDTTP